MEDNVDTIIAKYGQKVPKKPRKGRAVLISVIVLIIVVAATVGALLVFKKPVTTNSAPTTTQVFNGPAPKDVVDKIASDTIITGLKNYFVSRTSAAQTDPNSDIGSVVYSESGYGFVTNVSAEDGLRFTLNDANAGSSKAAITTALQTGLVNAGFTKVAQDVGALSAYTVETYTKGGTVCQTVDYTGAKEGILEQGLLCISHAGLETAYKNVQTQLAKADTKDTSIAANAKAVGQTSITDGTKTLLTFTVQPKSGSPTKYYFATTGTDYEYLGSRPTPSVDDANSYTISDQLKKNIADPKWGTFLSDNIK